MGYQRDREGRPFVLNTANNRQRGQRDSRPVRTVLVSLLGLWVALVTVLRKMIDWTREGVETDILIAELQRRGISLPVGSEFWFDDLEHQSGTLEEIELSTRSYLTPAGKAEANHQIKLDRRRNLEWWVKIVGQVGALLTGLLGALIGLLAIIKK